MVTEFHHIMSNLSIPLGIDSLKIISQTVDISGNIIIDVESTKTETACHKCGQLTNKRHGHGEVLTVQHLPILDQPVFLRIRVVRYQCTHCDDHPLSSERYDWVEGPLLRSPRLAATSAEFIV